jgi:hypothetical protein
MASSKSLGHSSKENRLRIFERVLSEENEEETLTVRGLMSFSNMSKYLRQF